MCCVQMLMDPMGGICMTNDGNAILREITVKHPAAKTMIEIARTQDEEVGDGTTSVIILGMHGLPFAYRPVAVGIANCYYLTLLSVQFILNSKFFANAIR